MPRSVHYGTDVVVGLAHCTAARHLFFADYALV